MKCAVHLDRDARLLAQEVDFHPPVTVEGNREHGVHAESTPRFVQRLQPPIQKRLAGTAGAIHAFGVTRNRPRRCYEKTGERDIDTVANEPTYARGVVAFPKRV